MAVQLLSHVSDPKVWIELDISLCSRARLLSTNAKAELRPQVTSIEKPTLALVHGEGLSNPDPGDELVLLDPLL